MNGHRDTPFHLRQQLLDLGEAIGRVLLPVSGKRLVFAYTYDVDRYGI